MYNLQATLREITVMDLPITEITVEVLDLPLYLDMTAQEITVEVVDLFPVEDLPVDFPDLSPAQLGLHLDNSILHA